MRIDTLTVTIILSPPSSSSLQQTNIIGGAGTYAIMGARIICDDRQDLIDQISGIIDMGSDFL